MSAQASEGQTLQRYKDLQDIIAILGIDELSDEDDKLIVCRGHARLQRFLSQPFHVAEVSSQAAQASM